MLLPSNDEFSPIPLSFSSVANSHQALGHITKHCYGMDGVKKVDVILIRKGAFHYGTNCMLFYSILFYAMLY